MAKIPATGRWSFWIDRGGTFTDVVARAPSGAISAAKLLSENPGRYDDAALHGIRQALGLSANAPIPADAVAEVKMGTTVGTNALLERRGAATVLLITEGFADALRIGYQNRPRLFDLNIRLPEMLYQRVIEVAERVGARGEVLVPLDGERLRADLEAAFAEGFESAAIVFVHGYRSPDHEAEAARIARDVGFTQVSASHRVSPLMRLIPRGDTTMVDAYLSPLLRRYVDGVAAALGDSRLMFMKSNGGLTDARLFEGRDCILSGPAGGVVGAARTAERAGFSKIIGFDMGGTSTDVCHYDGAFERTFEAQVAGVRLRAPMMLIHTVAAGGGSLLHFDGGRYRVGPRSAGADPGPACYRKGGPLTVTDANLMVGKILPGFFPAVFGAGGDQPPDLGVVTQKFAALARDIAAATGDARQAVEVADGFLAIAVENMANAIKKISVQRGHDVTAYTLACFGGAGGQHACRVADALGMTRIVLHPLAGVLSALGMGLADISATGERAVEEELDEALAERLIPLLDELEAEALGEIGRQGVQPSRRSATRTAHIRYRGTDTTLPVVLGTAADMAAAFEAAHRRRFGFADPGRALIVEAVSVEAIGRGQPLEEAPASDIGSREERGECRFFSAGAWHDGPVVERAAWAPGERVSGPAIVTEPHGTIVVEAGWEAELTGHRDIVLTRREARPGSAAISTGTDPVMLEIFNNLFMSIAAQMGTVLENTAHSVNIKERRDFSCALFDPAGNLVANAPHMPVHLGAMGESVQAVIGARAGAMKAGDVYALNAPYNGGSHLPDVTVITPVFGDGGAEVLFYVASRGHHADIGGVTPGSMPPHSTTIAEEGVLIDDFLLARGGAFREAELRALLGADPYPARNPDQNVADIRAQIAANEMGVAAVGRMIGHFGLGVVQAYMGHVQDNAEESVRRVIGRLGDGAFECELDNGAVVRVAITVDAKRREAHVDFTGTSAQLPSNFNAPEAVTKAAVLFAFRALVADDIPLNAGCLKPIRITVPEGSMLKPREPAAVVAGNVETSQVITNALMGALGAVAGSQGTMNNFTFGNDRHQYYETICGGSGAGPGFDGTDAVHTHMTNSLLTDPEVLEWRYPVRLESFAIRRGSGGAGQTRGGDGVVRRVKFLEPMTASILSNNRRVPPFGLAGGAPGKVGRNRVVRADGSEEELPGAAVTEMAAGDVFVIETPGGGGFGPPGELEEELP